MPNYRHPGVYVEEKPSDIKPIVGVGTSTCGFVGIMPETITVLAPNPQYVPNGPDLPYVTITFPPQLPAGSAAALPPGSPATDGGATGNPGGAGASPALASTGNGAGAADAADAAVLAAKTAIATATRTATAKAAALKTALAAVDPKVPATQDTANKAKLEFRQAKDAVAKAQTDLANAEAIADALDAIAKPGLTYRCTGFADFKRHFGGFSIDLDQAASDPQRLNSKPGHTDLAQGVYAFFNNGGTTCHVMCYRDLTALQDPESLVPFEAVDEIALVAAPGIHDPVVQQNIIAHCQNMGDRFAILDSPPTIPGDMLTHENIQDHELKNSNYAALYFPWIKVFDIQSKLRDPDSDGQVYVGPSGHMAGLYARVDNSRGVHKAPANDSLTGVLDVRYKISNAVQDGLNPMGINCIRDLNGGIRPWGARTLGGDMNDEFKYINVRRLFLYLRKSIDRGTQWIVFEPNDRALWQKIIRNVSAFLTEVWRDGALFGSSPAEAFYVKCDDETNPPDLRELGRVTTEIGVSVTKPAEFVVFQISNWAGPKGS